MNESQTQPQPRTNLQILRTRHPPATYLHQLCDLLSSEGITLSPEDLAKRLVEMPRDDRLILAVEGDELIGYAHLRIVHDLTREAMAEVVAIIVQNHRRRQGFGRRLIAAAETWARQAKRAFLLLSSDVTRVSGQAFFTALGYDQEATKLEFSRSLHA